MARAMGMFVVGLAAVGLGFPLCSYAAEKPVKLELISAMAAQHPVTGLFQEWAKKVEEKTKGGVKITVHPSGTLVAPNQGYDSVVKGIADMAWHPISYNPGRFPLNEILDFPIGSHDNLLASKLANDMFSKFRPKELNDVKLMFFGQSPPYFIHTKKPVKTLEDLKGMKIKVFGGPQSDYVTALGAVPVAMPAPEVYDSISKGVIEGFVGTYEVLKSFKLSEVVSHTVESPRTALSSAAFLVVNKSKWDSIPVATQKTLEPMIKELGLQVPATYAQGGSRAKEEVLKAGHRVTVLTAAEEEKWAARVKPVLEREVKEREAKGLPAQEALTFLRDAWTKQPR